MNKAEHRSLLDGWGGSQEDKYSLHEDSQIYGLSKGVNRVSANK